MAQQIINVGEAPNDGAVIHYELHLLKATTISANSIQLGVSLVLPTVLQIFQYPWQTAVS